MNERLVFGSFVPLHSVIHRLDARTKLILCVWYVLLVFFADSLFTMGWLLLTLIIAIRASNVALKLYWRGLRPFFWVIVITAIFQILFSSGGQLFWHWGWMSITADGIINAFILIYRFTVIITASTVLTATTSTLQLAAAFSSLLKPLRWLKLPVDKLTLMLSIALRFVPTIMTQLSQIMNAQRARGMQFNQGGLLARCHHLMPIIIPLFVNSFQRSEELATAMEARGYVNGARRTNYQQLKWHSRDTLALIIMLLVTIGLLILKSTL